ncbi:hypothetical protein WISP_146857 [Willisornis vidua]|uniref:Uncharacterized protein n=1 Tax=Willisornis vidua TaxID=1566151 RepID=A0ABQ9CQA3_9PASS|nr:hypothetical protein WISP_146857 [Willisornis vidua]
MAEMNCWVAVTPEDSPFIPVSPDLDLILLVCNCTARSVHSPQTLVKARQGGNLSMRSRVKGMEPGKKRLWKLCDGYQAVRTLSYYIASGYNFMCTSKAVLDNSDAVGYCTL